jgi:hypothetical protein
VAAVCLASFLGTATPARALVLDWNTKTWSNANMVNNASVSNSFDLNGDNVNDLTIAMTASNNTFTTDPTSGSLTPVVNRTLTGGQSPVANSLMVAGNLFTHSDLTVRLSFTGNQPGAANVSFTLFDIDVTTNSDIISGIFGVTSTGALVAPTISNVGSAVTLTGTPGGLDQVLTGNSASADSGAGSSNGNATITFGSTIITDIYFTFSNTAGAPRYQDIAMGNITFSPVPEINPAATSAVSCLLAVGLTVLAHRRAKLKASRLRAVQP